MRVVPLSRCSTICVFRAMRAEKSVGSASASSSALVCSDWVGALRCRHRLYGGACDIVEYVLRGERPAGGLAMGAQRQRADVLRIELVHQLRPQHARRAQLRHLHEKVHADAEEERQPRRKAVDVKRCRKSGADIFDTVRERIGELKVGGRSGLLHVIAGVAFRRGGRGPVLLLLHGIAGSSETWVPAMRLLQKEFTVLAPDFLGHGQSAKPLGDYSLGNQASAMRDFLRLLGIETATVVGQSFGGGVAMQFAYQFPEFCERLVLVDAGGLGREVNWILRLAALPGAEYAMPVLFPDFARQWGDAVFRFLAERGIRNPRAAEMWRSYRSLTQPENRRAFVRTMQAVIDPGGQAVSAMDRLYLAARIPTLIVWGDHDRIIPLSHAYIAHEAIPNSRLEVLEGVGHFPHVEEPDQFVRILVNFLRTSEPVTFAPEEPDDELSQTAAP